MTEYFSFSEFYPKSPIPITENFKLFIQEKHGANADQYTHLLIALEGCECSPKPFQWRVGIYLSNHNGSFDYRLPYFRSSFITTFHEALELLREIETKAKRDELMTVHP